GDSYTPGSSDAGDIGDFYQWGRVADGHQNTVWYKGTDHIDSIGTSAKWSTTNYPVADEKTSGVVAYSVGANTYDIATHQVTGDKVGKFISADLDIAYDWYYNGGHDDGLWGNSTSSHNCRKSC
ncbi:MAG: hypothetical protein LBT04_00930, partial [Prevotellaceae bacterium]|nr:hypothetical protein [Prevotellaceae bacterium]